MGADAHNADEECDSEVTSGDAKGKSGGEKDRAGQGDDGLPLEFAANHQAEQRSGQAEPSKGQVPEPGCQQAQYQEE